MIGLWIACGIGGVLILLGVAAKIAEWRHRRRWSRRRAARGGTLEPGLSFGERPAGRER